MTGAADTTHTNLSGAGIDLSRVEKWYGTTDEPVHALTETSLSVAQGEILVLLGPSGCGKTTLLRMMGGLLRPTRGLIKVAGHELWPKGARTRNSDAVHELGMVFQEANLFPWMNIEDNIALPLELRGVSRIERLARARALTRLVGIEGFEKRWPRELSGGMRQRAAIARALSYDPHFLLMDEPFGALDAMTRDAMNLELQRIWMDLGQGDDEPARTRKTIVMVTHSITEAVFLADRIVLLAPRPGKIDREITVKFPRPRDIDLQATVEFASLVTSLRHRLEEIS
jgi:NitT/TauT family transport system ATP-binding protein